jgi:uncharacterized protein YodC (DUF2158 family)
MKKTTKTATQKTDRALKPGDVVQLKSGGPLMTVQWLKQNNDGFNVAVCAWFDPRLQPFSGFGSAAENNADAYRQEEDFSIAALKRVEA